MGVDLNPDADADLVFDLNRYPYDLPEGRFSRIILNHVVEHLNDIPALFDELYRLARPGARIEIVTPHYSNRCSYTDPTHRQHLGVQFIDWFAVRPDRDDSLTFRRKAGRFVFEHSFDYETLRQPSQFLLLSQRITFSRIFKMLGVQWLANRYYRFWEFYFALLLPARDMHLVLEVRK